jgi:tetratricopeptide (TPR) repeat protein
MKVKNGIRFGCGRLLIGVLLAGALPAQDNKIIVGENARLFSKVLNEERTLQISRPVGYDNGNKAYPVVMTLDGGMTFRFTADIARYLAANGLMPEVIVVGIPNTNRNRDFIPELPAGAAPGGGPEAMQSGKIGLFLFNTELYPDSANAFDSLAEAHMKTGNKQLAIDNYKKVLKLDPKLKSTIDNLKKLEGN